MENQDKIKEEVKQKYTTKETFELIERMLKVGLLPKEKKISFEKELKEKATEIYNKEEKISLIAKDLCILKNQYFFLYKVLETKIIYLLRAIVFGINNDNHLLIALCSRSLLEHTASVCYLINKTDRIFNKIKKTTEYEQIIKHFSSLHDIYRKIFYGTRFFKNEGLVDAINVLTLIKDYLCAELKEAGDYYGYLSDFVHPNFGSNVLASSGKIGEGSIDPPIEEKKEIIEVILKITGIIIKFLGNKFYSFAYLGDKIDNYLERALHTKVTLSDIFSEPPLEYEGDGNSKESAILFTEALTHQEYIELQYKFMKQQRIISYRQSTFIDDKYWYDIHKTSKGEIWFKIPKEV